MLKIPYFLQKIKVMYFVTPNLTPYIMFATVNWFLCTEMA